MLGKTSKPEAPCGPAKGNIQKREECHPVLASSVEREKKVEGGGFGPANRGKEAWDKICSRQEKTVELHAWGREDI